MEDLQDEVRLMTEIDILFDVEDILQGVLIVLLLVSIERRLSNPARKLYLI